MAVRLVAVEELTEGHVLADAVLSCHGRTLLGKGSVLTSKHIRLLKVWDVQNVPIYDEGQSDIEQVIEFGNYKRLRDCENYLQFEQKFNTITMNVARTFELIKKRGIVPVSHLKDTAANIHSSVVEEGSMLMDYLLLGEYNNFADFYSRHSVMVAFLAGVVACQMKWSEEDIRGVTLSGLLHDLGSVVAGRSEKDSLHKAYISEAAVLLKDVKGLPGEVVLGIVQHRECMDGSGFPTGANSFKIHPYAKVIAVADAFHAQAYSEELINPFPVLNMLTKEMFGKLDPSVCHAFISRVRDSLLHNRILLSNGWEAEIIYFHTNGSCLPVIKTDDGQVIDLSQNGSLSVKHLLA